MRGIPKLDSNNKLYADGDKYAPSGEVSRRYGIVDMGTLTWRIATYSGVDTFNADVAGMYVPTTENDRLKGFICSKYPIGNRPYARSLDDKTALRASGRLYVRDTAYTTTADFKTAMSGVMLAYELTTPTTETADPYQQTQIAYSDGTEDFIDDRTIKIPVGHDSKYSEQNS